MKITIKAFSDYKKFIPRDASTNGREVDVSDGVTIEELLVQFNIPVDTPKVFTVNDTNEKSDYILKPDDFLKIFPLAMGG